MSGLHSPHTTLFCHSQGRLDNVHCPLDAPLTGLVRVAECDAKIRSIEVQLVRVETLQVVNCILFGFSNHLMRGLPLMMSTPRD